jgi:outer membrane protein OmpA-like peptidoglycan-associated protein
MTFFIMHPTCVNGSPPRLHIIKEVSMNFRFCLLLSSLFLAPVALAQVAAAQPVAGPYVSLGGMYDIESTVKAKDLEVSGFPIPGKSDVVYKNGFDANLALGFGLGNGFRIEVEGDFGRNANDKVKMAGMDIPSGEQEERYGAFLNGYYDFDLGLPITPYLGAGAGWQDTNIRNFSGPIAITKTKGSFAYQGTAGISYNVTAVPGLAVYAEYRFLGIAGSRKVKFGYSAYKLPASVKLLAEYDNEVGVGVRYAFGAPALMAPAPVPAPVAAPAPAPAKTYLIFFDWDKYNLTPRATAIIAQAASDSHTQNTTTINVSGYTDTSGTFQYNQGLSERRAQAVAAQLVTDGVPQSEISIHAYGETHLLVPTGPGVREPQNRRVEIVLD